MAKIDDAQQGKRVGHVTRGFPTDLKKLLQTLIKRLPKHLDC